MHVQQSLLINLICVQNDKDSLDRQVIDLQSEIDAKNKELADKEVELTQEKDKFKILQVKCYSFNTRFQNPHNELNLYIQLYVYLD